MVFILYMHVKTTYKYSLKVYINIELNQFNNSRLESSTDLFSSTCIYNLTSTSSQKLKIITNFDVKY